MVFTTLRVRGIDFPVDTFLSERQLEVSTVWRRGEPTRTGRPHEDSGFNIAQPDADSWVIALPVVRAFLESQSELLDDLHTHGVEVILDLGVTAGEEKSYAPSLDFPPDLLAQFAARGVTLCVSAYPTSDEA